MSLVHMDIKPGNIFLSHEFNAVNVPDEEGDVRNHYDSADDGFDEHEDQLSNVTYKIGLCKIFLLKLLFYFFILFYYTLFQVILAMLHVYRRLNMKKATADIYQTKYCKKIFPISLKLIYLH